MSPATRRLLLGALSLVLLFSVSCTEDDNQLFGEIGVTRLLLIDPTVAPQQFLGGGSTFQVVQWNISSAVLTVDDASLELAGAECTISDTGFISPVAVGDCSGGIVIPSSTQPQTFSLVVTIESMQLRRATPADLSQLDTDVDGVPNDGDGSGDPFDHPCGFGGDSQDCDDNCVVLKNPDQADSNNDGIGNACSVFDFFTGTVVADSDADSVPDLFDNCVWLPNPGQEDTSGLTAAGITDAIGDACTEQIFTVKLNGASTFVLDDFPAVQVAQPLGQTSFVTLDFGGSVTIDDCDVNALECELDADQVSFCALIPGLSLLNGCP